MELTRACLSPWQIDRAELIASAKPTTTSAEILSCLESFVNAYLLFDKVFVLERYRQSPFLRTLDAAEDIFAFDSRITDPYQQTDGHTKVDIDPSLLFKNRKHLKPKSNGWLKQHLSFDLSKRGREDLIEHLNRSGRSTAWFYQLLLAEYQMLFDLATANNAFLVVFASMAQVYLPDVTELGQFAAFLARKSKTSNSARSDDTMGTYSFEFPTGGVEARIRMPSPFEAVVRRAGEADLLTALRHARKQYEPLREQLRAFTMAFAGHEGSELVSSDMTRKEIQEWNDYVTRSFASTEELLLLKSDVVAVEVRAGDDADIYQTLRDRVVARGSLLRLVPPQTCLDHARSPQHLKALGIENVIPFEPKLLRIGRGYVNKRHVLHRGMGLMVGLPLAVGAQLDHEGLNHPSIHSYGRDQLPHLYMICTRPKITISPHVGLYQDRINLEFRFQQPTHTDTGLVSLARNNVRSVIVDSHTHTQIVFNGYNGERSTWHPSLLYQSLVKSAVPEHSASVVLDPEGAGLSEQQIRDVARADLEVIYIGQSRGRDFDRTAIVRLNGHEKWDTFFRDIEEHNPHREMWILLITQSPPKHFNMTIPGSAGHDSDVAELTRRTNHPISVNPLDRLNFTEAALISYFKPRFNDKFKNGAFPSKKHESYERFFLEPIDVAALELETLQSAGCRLYSKNVAPRALHLKMWRFNPAFDVWNMFSGT